MPDVIGVFEAAKAAVTHPTAVAANRAQLVSLVRSNLFGFNAPAIAATEGAYEAMWAQNVTALSGYHGAASAVAAQLAPWQQALQALPGLAGSAAAKPAANILQTVATEDKQAIVTQKNLAKTELSSAGNIAIKDLSKAGTALGSGHIAQAAVDVTAAGLIETGVVPYVAIQDAALLLELPIADIAVIGEQL